MKPVFSVLHVILLICIAYFCVKLFYDQIRLNPFKVNSFSPPKTARNNKKETSPINSFKQEYEKIKNRNLFNVNLDKKIQNGPHTQDNIPSISASAQPLKMTNLDLTLWGTIIGTINTYAVIEDKKIRLQNLYRIGDQIQGAIIKQILRDRVILRYNDKDYALLSDLTMTPDNSKAVKTDKTPSNSQKIMVDESMIRSSLNNIEDLKRQIGIRPVVSKGKSEGLLLYRIKPNSVFQLLGLQNGDVLKKINGTSVLSLNDVTQIYQDINTKDQVNATVLRNGKEHELTYQLNTDKGTN